MSGFRFEATDLLDFVIVSSHCWTGFSGCLISYQCKDLNSVSQQMKCQGYACSSPSAETVFCQKGLSAAYLCCWAPMNICARPSDFQFTKSPFLPRNLYSCVGRGKWAFQVFQFRVGVLTVDELVQAKKICSWYLLVVLKQKVIKEKASN